jgi:2-phosphoglycerate kinase
MDNSKLELILGYLVFGLFALNIALTAAKSVAEKVAETFKKEDAGKVAITLGKIAEIIAKVLSFISANTTKK